MLKYGVQVAVVFCDYKNEGIVGEGKSQCHEIISQ